MKILFLVPPETISLESSVPKALEGGKGYYPKLGLLYVAAYYERETGSTRPLSTAHRKTFPKKLCSHVSGKSNQTWSP